MSTDQSIRKVCRFPECGRTNVIAKGLCYSHYEQQRAGKELYHLCLTVRPRGSPPRIVYEERPCSEWGLRNGLTTPCHVWTGRLDDDGYGIVSAGGKSRRVHKYVYERDAKKVEPGLVLDHQCRVRACCNPGHLREVTNQVNSSENFNRYHSNKTHCEHGHEFTEENTYRYKTGRYCRQCRKHRQYKMRTGRDHPGETAVTETES